MSRKIYFDSRTKKIGLVLIANDFKEQINETEKIYTRATLQVIQQDGELHLINNARKEKVTASGMLYASDLDYFIRTGNFPTSYMFGKPTKTE